VSQERVVLRCGGVHKRFHGSIALRGASLELRAGEVHALIGENGSGKSTLLNIISGQLRADDGTVEVLSRPLVAQDSSVAIVTQELSLAPDLTVAENIMMGRQPTWSRIAVSWRHMRTEAAQTLRLLGVDIDVMLPVSRLSVDLQQMVEIARAIRQDRPVLILDEPTSSLTAVAADALFASISALRETGVAIVIVSHRLEELLAIADRFTVLRDGVTVSEGRRDEYDRATLIQHMMGHAPEEYRPSASTIHDGQIALRVRGLSVTDLVHGVGFEVRSGEAVGLVGLEGSGRSEVVEAIFGLRPDARGAIDDSGLPRSPHAAIERGLALVPNDRKGKGLFPLLSPTDNISIAEATRGRRLRRIRRSAEAQRSKHWVERFSINGGTRRQVSELSGGNQQKVLLSKWLCLKPSVLLLDEPTRGVDVVAKSEIHRIIHEVRDGGMALVVSSAEIDELLLLCDRFVVLFRGRVVGILSRAEATEARLTHLATEGR
jgi:ABC-type sugar transport system ATPase subunit